MDDDEEYIKFTTLYAQIVCLMKLCGNPALTSMTLVHILKDMIAAQEDPKVCLEAVITALREE